MTAGKLTRLSEKLNADLEEIRKEHADLMVSQLKIFRTDIQTCVTHARDTIETDTRMFLEWSDSTRTRHVATITRLMRISPWVMAGACLIMITATLGLTFLWSWKLSEMTMQRQLQSLGIQTVRHQGATYLIPNPETASIRTCTMAGRAVSCIKVEMD